MVRYEQSCISLNQAARIHGLPCDGRQAWPSGPARLPRDPTCPLTLLVPADLPCKAISCFASGLPLRRLLLRPPLVLRRLRARETYLVLYSGIVPLLQGGVAEAVSPVQHERLARFLLALVIMSYVVPVVYARALLNRFPGKEHTAGLDMAFRTPLQWSDYRSLLIDKRPVSAGKGKMGTYCLYRLITSCCRPDLTISDCFPGRGECG